VYNINLEKLDHRLQNPLQHLTHATIYEHSMRHTHTYKKPWSALVFPVLRLQTSRKATLRSAAQQRADTMGRQQTPSRQHVLTRNYSASDRTRTINLRFPWMLRIRGKPKHSLLKCVVATNGKIWNKERLCTQLVKQIENTSADAVNNKRLLKQLKCNNCTWEKKAINKAQITCKNVKEKYLRQKFEIMYPSSS
jgi:K+-sensing histidine kinase KdpD